MRGLLLHLLHTGDGAGRGAEPAYRHQLPGPELMLS